MGVEYNASIAWGLKVEYDACPDDFEDGFFEWVEQLEKPAGFSLVAGGNSWANSTEETKHAVVIGPQASFRTVADKYSDNCYGVFKIDTIYIPTINDEVALRDLAQEIGVPYEIGWFSVSSVS